MSQSHSIDVTILILKSLKLILVTHTARGTTEGRYSLKGFFSRVNSVVPLEARWDSETLPADFTLVRRLRPDH